MKKKKVSSAILSSVNYAINKNKDWKLVMKDKKPYWLNLKTNQLIWVDPETWKKRPKNITKGVTSESRYKQWDIYWDRINEKWFF